MSRYDTGNKQEACCGVLEPAMPGGTLLDCTSLICVTHRSGARAAVCWLALVWVEATASASLVHIKSPAMTVLTICNVIRISYQVYKPGLLTQCKTLLTLSDRVQNQQSLFNWHQRQPSQMHWNRLQEQKIEGRSDHAYILSAFICLENS